VVQELMIQAVKAAETIRVSLLDKSVPSDIWHLAATIIALFEVLEPLSGTLSCRCRHC
jgi:hypothetical protein